MSAINDAYPVAEVEPGEAGFARAAEETLPEEDDLHVVAAAITAEATVLCTDNTSDFPAAVADDLRLEVLTPD